MALLTILLIAISLSMDALAMGISYGLRGIRTPWYARLILCGVSVFITGSAVAAGSLVTLLITPEAAKLIGIGMLAVLGIVIILQAFLKKKEAESCDFDHSKHIDALEAVYLGVALSIDSFGAGISTGIAGGGDIGIPLAAGLCQVVFLCAGEFCGKKLKYIKADDRLFTVISGVLLLILAAVRYFC